MPRMTIRLEPEEIDALAVLSRKEHRDLQGQAAMLIRQHLERKGLLVLVPRSSGDHALLRDRSGERRAGDRGGAE